MSISSARTFTAPVTPAPRAHAYSTSKSTVEALLLLRLARLLRQREQSKLAGECGEVFADADGVGGVGRQGEVPRECFASLHHVSPLVVEKAELAEGVGVSRIQRGRALIALDGPSHIVVLLRRHLLGP